MFPSLGPGMVAKDMFEGGSVAEGRREKGGEKECYHSKIYTTNDVRRWLHVDNGMDTAGDNSCTQHHHHHPHKNT